MLFLRSGSIFSKTNDTLTIRCEPKEIKAFKKNIHNYANIKSIKLIGNNPKTNWGKLLQQISTLDSLEEIIFESNEFIQLPKSINKLNKIKSLSIIDNEDLFLDSCVSQISTLTSLKKFSFEVYTIRDMPQNISKLSNIQNIVILNKDYLFLDPDSTYSRKNEYWKEYLFDIPIYKNGSITGKIPVKYIATGGEIGNDEFSDIQNKYIVEPDKLKSVKERVHVFDSTIINTKPTVAYTKIYQSVSPPFDGVNVEKKCFFITASTENKLLYPPSGTEIIIPANSFIDKNGNPVNENIVIDYREFRDPADFIVSGIPMTFSSPTDSLSYFKSAGMFEMNASKNGEEIFLKKGANISVNFQSTDTASNYTFYAFNDKENRWDSINKAPVKQIDKLPLVKVHTNAFKYFRSNLSAKLSIYDSTLFNDRFTSKNYSYTKRETEKVNLSVSKNYTFFSVNFNLFKKKNSGGQINAPSMSRHGKFTSYRVNNMVMLRGIKKTKEGDLLFSIRTYYIFHPEMKIFSTYKWILTDDIPYKDFKKNFGGRNKFNDIRIEQNGSEYTIKLKTDSTFKEFNAKTVRLTLLNKKTVIKEASPKYKNYTKALASREKLFNKQMRKGRLNDNNYGELNIEEKKKYLWQLSRKKMSDTELKMNYNEWMSYYDKIIADEQLAVNDSSASASNVLRSLSIDGFGIFNCDQIQRLTAPILVFASYQTNDNTILHPESTYIIDKKLNGVLCYQTGGKYNPKKFAFGKKSENTMVTTKKDGTMSVFTEVQFSQNKFTDRSHFTFNVREISTKITSVQDVRNALGL